MPSISQRSPMEMKRRGRVSLPDGPARRCVRPSRRRSPRVGPSRTSRIDLDQASAGSRLADLEVHRAGSRHWQRRQRTRTARGGPSIPGAHPACRPVRCEQAANTQTSTTTGKTIGVASSARTLRQAPGPTSSTTRSSAHMFRGMEAARAEAHAAADQAQALHPDPRRVPDAGPARAPLNTRCTSAMPLTRR